MVGLSGEEISRLNSIGRVDVTGTWLRHVPVRYRTTSLGGVAAYGRWSRKGGFPVLYLGRPQDSVVIEAYRHLVDKVQGAIASEVAPRVLVTCQVQVTQILDLTTAGGRATAGLELETLLSATGDRDAYAACQAVAAAAHQLGMHGILAPAATGLGETLALFTELLPENECPDVSAEEEWDGLPPDPRGSRPRLRVISS